MPASAGSASGSCPAILPLDFSSPEPSQLRTWVTSVFRSKCDSTIASAALPQSLRLFCRTNVMPGTCAHASDRGGGVAVTSDVVAHAANDKDTNTQAGSANAGRPGAWRDLDLPASN